MIRTFIGIRVASHVGKTLEHWIDAVRKDVDAKRWYGRTQFHITLHFLGDQSPRQLAEIDAICASVARGASPFTLRLHSIGVFERAKVMWAGVDGDTWILQDLYDQLRPLHVIASTNQTIRPKLTPHITLGRLRTVPSPDELDDLHRRIRSLDAGPAQWTVTQLERFQSVSTPSGVQYPTRKAFPFT
jgi:RNA 2',3'-cyclic 3'-phosphodiesterase